MATRLGRASDAPVAAPRPVSRNERLNEGLVRLRLTDNGYYAPDSGVAVAEQTSEIAQVKKLLKHASRGPKGGKGSPDFIISTSNAKDVLIVIECKASPRDHESPARDQPARYAVDGALHYAKALSEGYTVVAIGASGSTEAELQLSSFLWRRSDTTYRPLTNSAGHPVDEILAISDYLDLVLFAPEVRNQRLQDLTALSRDLHDFMRVHAKVTESDKPLLVSGTLIALHDPAFRKDYDTYTDPKDLQRRWFQVIREQLEKAHLPNAKREAVAQPYSSIAVHPELGKATDKWPRGVLYELIDILNRKVWPYVSIYHDVDVVGNFYGQFLKYTGGDKKALGIVLTPPHITELFVKLANLAVDSRVLDNCCGTGGFLIASMADMMGQAATEEQKQSIREQGLVGVEQLPNMYALAASNMILRGDGKANLYQGSCFDSAIIRKLNDHTCDSGMINPPYSQHDIDSQELVFVRYLLESLRPGGLGLAIVPMSCAIGKSVEKMALLKSHTLEAVMSMASDLFYPVGVVPCIMVFKAHTPHAQSNRKTWFGYWKEDGFVKTKHQGRIDLNERWDGIRDHWVSSFRNREVHPGESVMRAVGAEDEWCVEAYMETDYSKLRRPDFESVVRDYALFRLLGRQDASSDAEALDDD